MAAVKRLVIAILISGGGLLGGCAAQSLTKAEVVSAQTQTSILASSSPADGAIVPAPVDELRLHFAPPARLDEVIVAGPDGMMPAMVHSVGEVADYSIPLSGLGLGAYTISWRASAQGATHRGSFRFRVK